jgi:hypothetical protein
MLLSIDARETGIILPPTPAIAHIIVGERKILYVTFMPIGLIGDQLTYHLPMDWDSLTY